MNVVAFPIFPAGTAMYYLLWRIFDFVYFWSLQLQYLTITIFISTTFFVLNVTTITNLNFSRWMEKYHAETPVSTSRVAINNRFTPTEIRNLQNILLARMLYKPTETNIIFKKHFYNETFFKNESKDVESVQFYLMNFFKLKYSLKTTTLPSLSENYNVSNLFKSTNKSRLSFHTHSRSSTIPAQISDIFAIFQTLQIVDTNISENLRMKKLNIQLISTHDKKQRQFKNIDTILAWHKQNKVRFSLKNLKFDPVLESPSSFFSNSNINFDLNMFKLLKFTRWIQMSNPVHKLDNYEFKSLTGKIQTLLFNKVQSDYKINLPIDFCKISTTLPLSFEWMLNRSTFNNTLSHSLKNIKFFHQQILTNAPHCSNFNSKQFVQLINAQEFMSELITPLRTPNVHSKNFIPVNKTEYNSLPLLYFLTCDDFRDFVYTTNTYHFEGKNLLSCHVEICLDGLSFLEIVDTITLHPLVAEL